MLVSFVSTWFASESLESLWTKNKVNSKKFRMQIKEWGKKIRAYEDSCALSFSSCVSGVSVMAISALVFVESESFRNLIKVNWPSKLSTKDAIMGCFLQLELLFWGLKIFPFFSSTYFDTFFSLFLCFNLPGLSRYRRSKEKERKKKRKRNQQKKRKEKKEMPNTARTIKS